LIKAIIFDMGGVVFKNVMDDTYEEVGKKFDIDPKLVKDESRSLRIEWQLNKISTEEFFRRLASILKISDASSLKDVWNEAFIENCAPNKKAIEIIKKLKRQDYKVAVLSNVTDMYTNHHRDRKDYDLFSFVFLSFELRMRKPEKEIYEYVINKMNVKFEECIFIDDKEVNLVTARKLGMKTILFQSAEQLEKELKKLL